MRLFRNTQGFPANLVLCTVLNRQGQFVKFCLNHVPTGLLIHQPLYCYTGLPPIRDPSQDSHTNQMFQCVGFQGYLYLPSFTQKGDVFAIESYPAIELA